ncbi:MAG: helix-turn-helix domain-containing protein [Oscillospiraceae bacterium]|nr:helix-turn-helix domain-containing protein [Oscillospiraceae bacterium]
MIRHLNPMTFQAYGTILPERPDSTKSAGKGDFVRRLQLGQGEFPVYQTQSDTWLYGHSPMTVLAVRVGEEDFRHFYLDKPVSLRSGVVFCLVPLDKEATAEIAYRKAPEEIGKSSLGSGLQQPRRLRVESLYTFFYQEKEQGFIFPGEAHPMTELTYVDQGSLHSVVDGQDLLLEQGDVTVYMPDQFHMQYSDMGVAPRFVTISFQLEGKGLERLRGRRFQAPQQAVTLLQQMLREQEGPDELSGDLIMAQLEQLLILLLRQVDAPAGKLKTSNGVHSENEIIRKAQQFISANVRQKLTVPMVAEKVQVSASYLTALFHKNLQISPGEYIRRIKLQESKQMIREDSMTFTQIAAELQYSTVHHFSRQFKEKFGITPTEYAKSVR